MMLHLLTEEGAAAAAAVCLPMTLNLNRGRRRSAVAALQVHPVVLVHADQAARRD